MGVRAVRPVAGRAQVASGPEQAVGREREVRAPGHRVGAGLEVRGREAEAQGPVGRALVEQEPVEAAARGPGLPARAAAREPGGRAWEGREVRVALVPAEPEQVAQGPEGREPGAQGPEAQGPEAREPGAQGPEAQGPEAREQAAALYGTSATPPHPHSEPSR
ncbi:hypothetical protein [Streptomyces olivoreticuli]|uniref:hypothetical protein n=1 Tax=Streptomyces olivoreticuli TaxID=68246 RepID=UPI00196876A4|nr:hypothetical protein [Streptomyces olivoreticuli]